MSRLRYLLLLLIVAIPVFLLLLFPFILGSEWARKIVEQQLSSQLARKVELNKRLAVSFGSELSVQISELTISNPEHMPAGQMLKIGELTLKLPVLENLLGAYRIASVDLKNSEFSFLRDNQGSSNWEFSDQGKPKEQTKTAGLNNSALKMPLISNLVLNNVDFRLSSESSWKELIFHKCNASLNDETTVKDCDLSIDQQKVDLQQLTISSINQLLNGEKTDFNISFKHSDNSLTAGINLKPTGDIDARLSFSGKNLKSFGQLVKQELPDFSDYDLNTKLDIKDNFNNFIFSDLILKTDGSDLKGNLNLNISPLEIKLRAKSDKLDLSQISKKFESKNEQQSTENTEKEEQIPYQAFEGILADIDIQVQDFITFLGLQFKNAQLAAQLKNSHLTVSHFAGKSLGGEVTASVSAKKEELLVKLDGKGFDANPITVLSGGKALIDGQFNLSADLKANGQKISEIKKSMSGKLGLSSIDAKIKSRTLETVSSGLLGILSPIFGGSDQAQIGCLIFNYELKNGIASSREQVIKLGEAFIFAKGSLDFPADRIKYDFYVNSSNPSLASLIPPFRAVGAIGSPRFMPSVTASVASVMDTTEGVARSALNLVGRGANFLTGAEFKAAEGIEVCQIAYKNEQGMISSRLGRVVE